MFMQKEKNWNIKHTVNCVPSQRLTSAEFGERRKQLVRDTAWSCVLSSLSQVLGIWPCSSSIVVKILCRGFTEQESAAHIHSHQEGKIWVKNSNNSTIVPFSKHLVRVGNNLKLVRDTTRGVVLSSFSSLGHFLCSEENSCGNFAVYSKEAGTVTSVFLMPSLPVHRGDLRLSGSLARKQWTIHQILTDQDELCFSFSLTFITTLVPNHKIPQLPKSGFLKKATERR